MKSYFYLRFVLLTVIVAYCPYVFAKKKIQKSHEITIGDGTVSGLETGETFAFLGIPYASSFVDDLRWRRPTLIAKYKNLQAHSYGSSCPHMDKFNPDAMFTRSFSGGVDCLNLNVWVPKKALKTKDQVKLPVMVFMPGGGFQVGSSSWSPFGLPIYNGERLAELGNVIIVSINYRTGTNGFFYDPDLALREPEVGNLGHIDQLQAFSWVKANISAFGGDQNNVTAFGSSSGAMSLCNLITHPDAKGLFQKAILQSGTCWVSSKEYATSVSKKLIEKVGCSRHSDGKIKTSCLVELPLETLAKAEPEMDYQSPSLDNFFFSPVFDNAFFKEYPDAVIKAKRHMDIPILIGSNQQEIPPFMMKDSKENWERLFTNWNTDPETKKKIKAYYEQGNIKSYEPLLGRLKTDFHFGCRARYYADLFSASQKSPVYLYQFEKNIFDVMDKWVKGSFHGMELFYVFQQVPPFAWLPGVAPHLKFQEKIGKLWTHFAYTGNVQSDSGWPDWKPFAPGSQIVGVLGDSNHAERIKSDDICNLLVKTMQKEKAGISLIE
jgi:para-nitrobenzyl esterase